MKYLILDTETGSFDPQEFSILSLGAVVWEDQRLVDELEIFVREPAVTVDPESLAKTKFDLASLAVRGRCPADAVNDLSVFLDKHFGPPGPKRRIPVAGHNVWFDVEFCRRMFRLAKQRFHGVFSHRYLDTASVLAFLVLTRQLPETCADLDGALAHFKITISPNNRHTALGDARVTAELITHLMRAMAPR